MANENEAEDRKIIVDRYTKGREKILDQIDEWEDPKFELHLKTDRYGFIQKENLPERLTQYEAKIRALEAARSSKWVKMLNNWNSPETREKLRERVYKGIPDQVRGKAWCLLLGVGRVKQEQEGRYQEMLTWGLVNSPDVRQIDLDVNRTFRNNVMFRDRYDIKQQELFRILVAYSVYNSEIGYCQGMSQIAALLLMYLHDEEDAFWALDRLMTDERYAMHGFFIPGFPKLQRFARHHDLVLKKFLPKVYKHFKKFDIDSTLYTLKWFFQCFLDRVPFSLTLRLWDCFMLEGEIILTSMSYTLLKLHKRTVLKKGMEELIEFLQIDLEKDFGYHDDEAITALAQSIAELRKAKMHVPKDAPSDMERPTKPFGWLLQADNMSMSQGADDQSVVGSIILRDEASLSRKSSRASSQTDLNQQQQEDESGPNETPHGRSKSQDQQDNESDEYRRQTVTNVEVNGGPRHVRLEKVTSNGIKPPQSISEKGLQKLCVRESSLPIVRPIEAIVSQATIVRPDDRLDESFIPRMVTVMSPSSPPGSTTNGNSPVEVVSVTSNAEQSSNLKSNLVLSHHMQSEKVRIYVPFSAVVSDRHHKSSNNVSKTSSPAPPENSYHSLNSSNSYHIESKSGLPPVDTI